MNRFFGFIFAFVFVCSSVCAETVPTYSIVDLGLLGTTSAVPYGINNLHQVVGVSNNQYGYWRAFLWLPAPAYGFPAGINDLGLDFGQAKGINDAGQIVGQYRPTSDATHAFRWQPGTLYDLGHTTTGVGSQAYGVNSLGNVVVDADLGVPPNWYHTTHAMLWGGGTLTDCSLLASDVSLSHASAINDHNQVAGTYKVDAFLWQNGSMKDLGPGGGNAINDSGNVAGYALVNGSSHAAYWDSSGTLRDLDAVKLYGQSAAYGINDSLQIVGDGGAGSAILWENGSSYYLQDLLVDGSGWSKLTRATGISDDGYIIGYGNVTGGSDSHAFMLVPNSVPEPSTVVLLSLGLAGSVLCRRRFRFTH